MKKSFEEKSGNSFARFEKFAKKILNVPKKEIDKREAEYQKARKAAKNIPETDLDDGPGRSCTEEKPRTVRSKDERRTRTRISEVLCPT